MTADILLLASAVVLIRILLLSTVAAVVSRSSGPVLSRHRRVSASWVGFGGIELESVAASAMFALPVTHRKRWLPFLLSTRVAERMARSGRNGPEDMSLPSAAAKSSCA